MSQKGEKTHFFCRNTIFFGRLYNIVIYYRQMTEKTKGANMIKQMTTELRDRFYTYYEFAKIDGEYKIIEKNGQVSPINIIDMVTEYPFFNEAGFQINNQKELESYFDYIS